MENSIILASASEGRREIFETLELPFVCIPTGIDETIPWKDPTDEIRRLAIKKANYAHISCSERDEKWIFAADTMIIFRGKPIGKPADRDEAEKMLRLLSGKTHKVITGIAFMERSTKKIYSESEISCVKFARLSENEIQWYLNTEEWRGAAGGYRIQKKGSILTEKIKGSFSNVIGLPIRSFFNIMLRAGYPVIK